MFVITNEQYRSGLLLEEYNNKYSLTKASESKKDGKIYKEWCKFEKRDGTQQTVPWGILLGSKSEAIDILRKCLAELTGETVPSEADDIPF